MNNLPRVVIRGAKRPGLEPATMLCRASRCKCIIDSISNLAHTSYLVSSTDAVSKFRISLAKDEPLKLTTPLCISAGR